MTASQPPEILGLLSDPLRWQLVVELGRSDLRVGELVQLVAKPQNVVSYHLALLRLRRPRPRAPQLGRWSRCLLLRRSASLSGPPRRGGPRAPPGALARPTASGERASGRARPRVLFLCTGNSARSQIAEALVEHRSVGTVEARSAGSHPEAAASQRRAGHGRTGGRHRGSPHQVVRPLHPAPVRSRHHAVRQGARDLPPVPGAPIAAHWSIPDPAAAGDNEAATYTAFQTVADEVEERVDLLLSDLRVRPANRERTIPWLTTRS